MCVYECVYVCVYIYVCVIVCVYICVCVCMYAQVCVFGCVGAGRLSVETVKRIKQRSDKFTVSVIYNYSRFLR